MTSNKDEFYKDQVLTAIRDGATTVTTIEARTGLKSRVAPTLNALLSQAGVAQAYQYAPTRAARAALVRRLVAERS
jgi:hypothetical protein